MVQRRCLLKLVEIGSHMYELYPPISVAVILVPLRIRVERVYIYIR